MTEKEQFEALKDNAIKDLEIFINAIRVIDYNDLQDLSKRFQLMQVYKNVIVSNSRYRSFIHDKHQFDNSVET